MEIAGHTVEGVISAMVYRFRGGHSHKDRDCVVCVQCG